MRVISAPSSIRTLPRGRSWPSDPGAAGAEDATLIPMFSRVGPTLNTTEATGVLISIPTLSDRCPSPDEEDEEDEEEEKDE